MKHLEVIIISPSPVICAGMESLLTSSRREVTVYTTDDPQAAIARLGHNRTLVFSDPSLLDQSHHQALSRFAKLKLAALTTSLLPHSVSSRFDAVVSVYDSAETIMRLVDETVSSAEESDDMKDPELTPREKEIVVGIVRGWSNKEIAAAINVSINTVTTHRRNIAAKLQIHSPAGLTIYAIVKKLVSIDELHT